MDWVQMNMAVCEALGLHPAGITQLTVSLENDRIPQIQATFQTDENAPAVRYQLVPLLDAPAPAEPVVMARPSDNRVNPWVWPDPPPAQQFTTVTNGA